MNKLNKYKFVKKNITLRKNISQINITQNNVIFLGCIISFLELFSPEHQTIFLYCFLLSLLHFLSSNSKFIYVQTFPLNLSMFSLLFFHSFAIPLLFSNPSFVILLTYSSHFSFFPCTSSIIFFGFVFPSHVTPNLFLS